LLGKKGNVVVVVDDDDDGQPKSTNKGSNTYIDTRMLIASSIHFGYHKGVDAT